jgi:hypothetical protein
MFEGESNVHGKKRKEIKAGKHIHEGKGRERKRRKRFPRNKKSMLLLLLYLSTLIHECWTE